MGWWIPMSKEKRQFIKQWLFTHKKFLWYIAFILCLWLIFGFAFNALEWMLYLIVLVIIFSAIFLTSWCAKDFLQYKKIKENPNWKELLQSEKVWTTSEQFLLETLEDYAAQLAQAEFQQREAYKEQLDYYTMWIHQIKTSIASSQLLIQALPTLPEKSPLEQELIKITTYTDFVLHYVRMETFHQDLVLREHSLDSMIRQILKKFATFFIYKNLRLSYEAIDQVIVTDAKWFSVILEQILLNSIKYTDKEGQISIYLDGSYLCIQDTGIGIAESDQQRIFERGFSGFNGRMNYHSSGLGLYLSNEIAKNLGLELSVESVVGEGTTLKILLQQNKLDTRV